jgi:hypothetical protein
MIDITLEYKTLAQLLNDNTFDSIRLYKDKPSVTSVLKILQDPESIVAFKNKQPEYREDMMNKKAAAWTVLHDTIEKTYKENKFNYINTEHAKAWIKFWTSEWCRWKPISLEEQLIDEETWGRLDAVMSIQWTKYLVDRKSAWKQYYDNLIFKYLMQLSRYIQMYKYKYNEDLDGKIVFFSIRWSYKILNLPNKERFQSKYKEVYDEFTKKYNLYLKIKEWESNVN